MRGTEVEQTRQRSSPRSAASNDEHRHDGFKSRRRQPKSRSGCNTCKARRMKCDEAKPSCSQCTGRGVECGGYARDLKWKLVEELPKERRRPDKIRSQGSDAVSTQQEPAPGDSSTRSPLQADMSLTADTASANNATSTRFRPEDAWPSLPHDHLFDFANVDPNDDFFLGDGNIEFNMPTELDSPTNTQSGQLSEDVCIQVLSSTSAEHTKLPSQKSPNFSGLIFSADYTQQDFEEIGKDRSGVPQSFERSQSANFSAPVQASRQAKELGSHNVLLKQPSFSDNPETVKHLFDNHLCDVLSIKDSQNTNPWLIHVWPLADRCPAVYHAVAAMTYLYMSNSQPQFQAAGSRNFHASLEALVQDEDSTSISLEASLAARLALGFAEAWDGQHASTGIEHVRIAGRLVRDALDKHNTTNLEGSELDRLNFLARTWIYKDIMIRLTASNYHEPIDLESMTAAIQLDPLPLEQQLDPLLGCAITLFPLIGRLTDIIKAVRRRTEKYNSPSTISKGAELRMAIEGWSPFFNPERSAGPKSHISDVIQTAEAYRWAALLLLRHAVPELPWSHSIWELAEKVSIYLATTSVTSRTMLIQAFPLIAIGGEAFDQEDRHWVRQRWDSMHKRIPLARLDQCKRVAEEVWRRRDAFEVQCGACPSCGAYRLTSSGISPATDTVSADDLSVGYNPEEGSRRCRCSAATRITAPASDFPDSLAFKKGVDNITRAGNLHYTVRGDLHWLGVMKDWNWEVMLG